MKRSTGFIQVFLDHGGLKNRMLGTDGVVLLRPDVRKCVCLALGSMQWL